MSSQSNLEEQLLEELVPHHYTAFVKLINHVGMNTLDSPSSKTTFHFFNLLFLSPSSRLSLFIESVCKLEKLRLIIFDIIQTLLLVMKDFDLKIYQIFRIKYYSNFSRTNSMKCIFKISYEYKNVLQSFSYFYQNSLSLLFYVQLFL